MNEDTTFKPTLSQPTPQGANFQKNTKKINNQAGLHLNETDELLSEVEQSLKKKIFSLAKMEALVFSDPKLSAKYEEMSENGSEKFGYHFNETIQNILFNDYVLNSPKYLQKYKQAVPKESKRRDASGINQLKKAGEETMQHKTDIKKPQKLAASGLKPVVAENEEPITRVEFLVNEKDPENPDLFAYFPDEIHHGDFRTAYSHVGQHSSAHPAYAKESRPATPEEYQPLKAELESLGYNLEVINGVNEETGSGSSGAFSPALGMEKRSLGEFTMMKDKPEANVDAEAPDEPQDDDCYIESNGNKYSVSCNGKFVKETADMDEALAIVKQWKQANNWFPNTWFVSDHGNMSLIDDEGNILNEMTGTGGGGGTVGGAGASGNGESSTGAYYTPNAWGSGDLMKTKGKAKMKTIPMIKGGTIIQESNYLIEPEGFAKYFNRLNEQEDIANFNRQLGQNYKQTHSESNQGLGVSEMPQSSERTNKIKEIEDNTMLFLGQDLQHSPDADVEIFHQDMTEPHTLIPHQDNKIPEMQVDGISSRSPKTPVGVWDKIKIGDRKETPEITDIEQKSDDGYGDLDNMSKTDLNLIDTDVSTEKLDNPNLRKMEESKQIKEVAKSKEQQRLFGMAHAVQKGELSPSKVGGAVKKIAKTVKPKDVEDFASTKHKGLPEKVNESDLSQLRNDSEHGNIAANKYVNVINSFVDKSNDLDQLSINLSGYFKNKNINDSDLISAIMDKAATIFKQQKGIDETDSTMIEDNPTSMSNKMTPTTPISPNGNVPTGMQSTGGGSPMNENDMKLLEELDKELNAYSIHQKKLMKMTEDKKPSSLILKDRLGDENKANFKKDFNNSDTKEIIDIEKELEWKDQQTDVPEDPQKLGADIEKEELKATDAKSGQALKNVGNSANFKGDEIPKRNMTTEEQNEVDMYRNGQHSLVYDNKPSEAFEKRMKADMGDKIYDMREKQLAFKGKAPMYNKIAQPIQDTKAVRAEFDKEKSGWNEREGLKEGMVTGKYFNSLGKRAIIDFNLNEVVEIKEAIPALCEVNLEGLGNTYTQKVSVNESVVKAMNENKFFTDGKKIFAMKNSQQKLNENEQKGKKPIINEQFEKMKHLTGYDPSIFTNTKGIKL